MEGGEVDDTYQFTCSLSGGLLFVSLAETAYTVSDIKNIIPIGRILTKYKQMDLFNPILGKELSNWSLYVCKHMTFEVFMSILNWKLKDGLKIDEWLY